MKRLWLLHLVLLITAGTFSSADAADQHPSPDSAAKQPASLVRTASEELQKGDFATAESDLRNAIKLGTHDPQAYNLIGFICDQSGRSEEALRYYQRALQLSPAFYPARNNLGSFYLRQGKAALALDQFRTTLKLAPDNATANYNIGIIEAQQGSLAAAQEAFERAHKSEPNDAGILYELAGVQSRLGDSAKASETLEAAHRLAPEQPMILVRLAGLQVDAGSSAEALSSLETVLNLLRQNPTPKPIEKAITVAATDALSRIPATSPSSDKAKFLMAEFQFVRKDYLQTTQTLATISGNARDVDYFDLLGLSLAGVGQFQDAVNALAYAIQLDSKRSDLLFHMGTVYQRANDNDTAIKIFNRAIAAGDTSPETQIALALSYFNSARYGNAVDACRRAITASATSYEAYLLMGRSYARLPNTTEKAINALSTSITLNPACEDCYFQLALVLLNHKREPEAINLLRVVIRINPSNASAHYQLGKVLAGRHENSEAIHELQTAITLEPKSDQAYYQLGRLYISMGDKEKGIIYLDTVREMKEKRLKTSQELVSGTK